MQHSLRKLTVLSSICLAMAGTAMAQGGSLINPAADTPAFKPSGKLWGYAFGDYAFKGSGDDAQRGGSNQYSRMTANSNLFQWRRIYLGYNYDISSKFSAEFLLAAEDDFNNNLIGQGTGDVLSDSKFSEYVKLANIRWKGIYKNADLVFGQTNTPGYAKQGNNNQTAEEVWGYRSIERTIADIHRTPSFDFGLSLQGTFDKKGNFGYTFMVGNGQGARPENDNFKAFYGSLFAKFMDKKLVFDLYSDYQKLVWNNSVDLKAGKYHSDRNMYKLFGAYTTPKFTVGAEVFMNFLMGDVAVTGKVGTDTASSTLYRSTKAMGFSVFTKGRIYKDQLGFFARYDNFDPTGNLSNITGIQNVNVTGYKANTSQYDPTNKESFITFGLDYTPFKNMHIMPNVWMNTYDCALSGTGTQSYKLSSTANGSKGTDAVYRLTFYYIYGK